ncbi:ABC transporter substrate-binding protein [Corynebacterium freiburgense]|uniref:ABC transporter substrate-binding protein n=1 Tax=Corynebacterium freiburgense TaxID=556548 RepID=UPI00047B42BD|nr:ABC transporter substrate-binding protein [Corynebacterium freiburgense]WJZ03627.1 High-affinity heme uptake system protein IsdE precursor [Corynebacterium freiburgense]
MLKRTATAIVLACLTLSACSAPQSGTTGGGSTTASEGASKSTGSVTVTDVLGREVSFEKHPERVVLGEGRGVFATSILDKNNPLDKVVALGSDLATAAPTYHKNLIEAVPETKDVPEIGSLSKGDVTVENLVSFEPDVVVITADHYESISTTGMVEKMEAAGLKFVVTDFRQHPLENTTKSMELLGALFNKEDQAKKFNEDWQKTVDTIREGAAKAEKRPKTFLWRAAGLKDCCATVKESNLGELINLAGGDNLGDHLLDGDEGDLTAEKIIAEQPEVIIATGGSWAPDKDKPEVVPHVELGYDTTKDVSEKTLEGLRATPGFDQLNGDLHAVWHQFYDSPFNYLALEQFAMWLQPELFKDLDPEAHLAEAHKEYLPFEASGVFFVSSPKNK